MLKFTRITAAFEETVYGASALYIGSHDYDHGAYGVSGHGYVWPDENARMKELSVNVHRMEGWRSTRSYYSCVQDLARGWSKRPVRGLDFAHQHDKLRCLRSRGVWKTRAERWALRRVLNWTKICRA